MLGGISARHAGELASPADAAHSLASRRPDVAAYRRHDIFDIFFRRRCRSLQRTMEMGLPPSEGEWAAAGDAFLATAKQFVQRQ